jgi:hypothetical protein
MNFGPCMCGDTQCSSCGPAQGNSKCLACGRWADDGSCADPDACAKKCQEIAEAEERDYIIDLLIIREAHLQNTDTCNVDITDDQMTEWGGSTTDQLREMKKQATRESDEWRRNNNES